MSSKTFTHLARADFMIATGDHDLYRTWTIPGYRDSDYYDGTGIENTYNLAPTDKEYPDDEDACPVLRRIDVGNNTEKTIQRKKVEHRTMVCPECEVEGRKGHSGEPFCPECGLLLSSTDSVHADHNEQFGAGGQMIVRNANTAERYS
jgi:hypothetical protein